MERCTFIVYSDLSKELPFEDTLNCVRYLGIIPREKCEKLLEDHVDDNRFSVIRIFYADHKITLSQAIQYVRNNARIKSFELQNHLQIIYQNPGFCVRSYDSRSQWHIHFAGSYNEMLTTVSGDVISDVFDPPLFFGTLCNPDNPLVSSYDRSGGLIATVQFEGTKALIQLQDLTNSRIIYSDYLVDLDHLDKYQIENRMMTSIVKLYESFNKYVISKIQKEEN